MTKVKVTETWEDLENDKKKSLHLETCDTSILVCSQISAFECILERYVPTYIFSQIKIFSLAR